MLDWLKGLASEDKMVIIILCGFGFMLGFTIVAVNAFDIIRLLIHARFISMP